MWLRFSRKLGRNAGNVFGYGTSLKRGVQASYDFKTLINMATRSVRINDNFLILVRQMRKRLDLNWSQ